VTGGGKWVVSVGSVLGTIPDFTKCIIILKPLRHCIKLLALSSVILISFISLNASGIFSLSKNAKDNICQTLMLTFSLTPCSMDRPGPCSFHHAFGMNEINNL